MHRRGTDVARLASLDDVVQRLERLLDRGIIIPAVDLVEVDVRLASISAKIALRDSPAPFGPGRMRP
jgi:hypothetical protein